MNLLKGAISSPILTCDGLSELLPNFFDVNSDTPLLSNTYFAINFFSLWKNKKGKFEQPPIERKLAGMHFAIFSSTEEMAPLICQANNIFLNLGSAYTCQEKNAKTAILLWRDVKYVLLWCFMRICVSAFRFWNMLMLFFTFFHRHSFTFRDNFFSLK